MDELTSLAAAFKCRSAVLSFALQHPATVQDLLPLLRAMAEEVKSGGKPAPLVAPALSLPPGFATLQDMPCLVPRGKVDVEVGESGVSLRSKAGPKDAAPPPPVVLHVSNVAGVFHVTVKDRYKSGPAGLTHYVLLALLSPVLVGKTLHSVVGFADVGTAWSRAGGGTARLSRPPALASLKDAGGLDGLTRGTEGASPVLVGSDALHLLKCLLSSLFGRIGEVDRTIFVSSNSDSSVKCYVKAAEGQLFPLRRALVWTGKPLLVLPLSLVKEIKVARGGGSARTFDIDVKMADGKTFNFSMLDVNELSPLTDYVSTRTWGGAAPPPPPAPALATTQTPAHSAVASSSSALSGSASSGAPTAHVHGAAPSLPALNMNEGDSDEEGATRGGGGGGEEEDDDDDDDEEEYEEGDSGYQDDEAGEDDDDGQGEEEEEEEEEGEEGERKGNGVGRATASKRKVPAPAEEEEGEDDDEDEELGDDEDEEDLAALLAEAGADASPPRRGGGAASSSSSAAPAADAEGEEDGPAARLRARKRRAAASTSGAGRAADSAGGGDATDEEEGGGSGKKARRE